MDNLLILLKMDLQITVDAYDTFLKQLLDQAKEALEIIGINIDLNSINDCNIIRQYAAYLYRSRRGEDKAAPRSLQLLINNRLMKEAGENG